jgi:hypothetical protein
MKGWRTNRKIVVIESDDWGAIRMPSKRAFKNLQEAGMELHNSCYNRYDTLESREDMEMLFSLLGEYRDSKGNHPIMTFNTVMGNPDFEKIEESNFSTYYHVHFRDSYKTYYGSDHFELWRSAIKRGIIKPQFHAREHLNVSLWMQALQQNNHDARLGFDNRFYGMKQTVTPPDDQNHYLGAYWVVGEKDFKNKKKILEDGLELFEKTFRFSSDSFVACNYILPRELEYPLSECNVKYIQGQRGYLSPEISTGKKRINRIYTGKSNAYNQIFTVRNCLFEPSEDGKKDWINSCLNDISTSFFWKKPAIISSHRVNYIGVLDLKNRERGLQSLDRLLKKILEFWPDVEFMSTDQLGRLIEGDIHVKVN